jgi:hypothetical protein
MTLIIKDKRSDGSKSIEHKDEKLTVEVTESNLHIYLTNKRFKKEEVLTFMFSPMVDGRTEHSVLIPEEHITKAFYNSGTLVVNYIP